MTLWKEVREGGRVIEEEQRAETGQRRKELSRVGWLVKESSKESDWAGVLEQGWDG